MGPISSVGLNNAISPDYHGSEPRPLATQSNGKYRSDQRASPKYQGMILRFNHLPTVKIFRKKNSTLHWIISHYVVNFKNITTHMRTEPSTFCLVLWLPLHNSHTRGTNWKSSFLWYLSCPSRTCSKYSPHKQLPVLMPIHLTVHNRLFVNITRKESEQPTITDVIRSEISHPIYQYPSFKMDDGSGKVIVKNHPQFNLCPSLACSRILM